MRKLLLYIILLSSFIIADDQPPVFLPIESTEDFYSGSSIFLEVQVTDDSFIENILLYYRFSKEDSFASVPMDKEMYYVGEIPEPDVGLVAPGIARSGVDGAEDALRVEGVHECARAIVDRFPRNGGIVCVHHTVDEAERHPLGDQIRLDSRDRL